MSEFALQKNVPLEVAHLDLLATAGPRTIHVYDKLCVAVLSTDSGKTRDSNRIMVMSALKGLNIQHTIYFQSISRIYSNETSVIQTLQSYHPIIHVQFNQLIINYHDPRPEYIRVIIVEWSIKFSIFIARTVSPDNQYSSRLLNARRSTLWKFR
ncbi:unnamed protein product [Rotaria socialis]|uniref:Uncharacterized protein n=1 Tax=Rotaria socialis TaxID=392032 RepID=A0A818LZ39_9BILA|nr:unnamed protein product [Rotaria socialis]